MRRLGQNRLEWALLGLITVVCAALSILQYFWTGEVSRAERARLGSALNEQVIGLTRSFDDGLRENCVSLIPSATEIHDSGVVQAHRSRYQQWALSHDRDIFNRIGIATPEHGKLHLYGIDGEGGIVAMDWPAQWETLRTTMSGRLQALSAHRRCR